MSGPDDDDYYNIIQSGLK